MSKLVELLMKLLARFVYGDMEEYFERFMAPEVRRLRDVGVSAEDIDALVHKALETRDPTIVGQAPGSRLAVYADLVQAGVPVQDILSGGW